MSAALNPKHLIRAGAAILFAWLLVSAVMLVAFQGYLPRRFGMPTFMATSACVFPYEASSLSETTRMVLTIGHWTLSIVVFTFAGSRLRWQWAFVAALLSVALLAILARVVLHLLGLL
jgi:hypothetical protein